MSIEERITTEEIRWYGTKKKAIEARKEREWKEEHSQEQELNEEDAPPYDLDCV